MRIDKAQLWLAGVFLGGLLVNIALVVATYLNGAIYIDDLRSLSTTFAAVYSVPLATVLAGFFAQRDQERNVTFPSTFWLAIGVALLWNLLLVLRSAIFGIAGLARGSGSLSRAQDSVEEFSTYVTTVSAAATFLVSGFMTYFFAKRG